MRSLAPSLSWWTFRPRKKVFCLPPPNSPIRRRHPPGPSAPPVLETPPPGIFNKKLTPPPPGASDSPFETSTKLCNVLCALLRLYAATIMQVTPALCNNGVTLVLLRRRAKRYAAEIAALSPVSTTQLALSLGEDMFHQKHFAIHYHQTRSRA